jgi:hypothetical protein
LMSLVREKVKAIVCSWSDNKKWCFWKRCWYDDRSIEYEWCSENGARLTEKEILFCHQRASFLICLKTMKIDQFKQAVQNL